MTKLPLAGVPVLATVFAFVYPVSGQICSRCSSISGSCAPTSGSTTCDPGAKIHSRVTYIYSCVSYCTETNCDKTVEYVANPSSQSLTATGECGSKKEDGSTISDAVNCPPVLGTAQIDSGGCHVYDRTIQQYTQSTDVKLCIRGNAVMFHATCEDRQCKSSCSDGGGSCNCPNDGYHFKPNFCEYPSTGCPSEATFEPGTGCCADSTPILIDLSGDGFYLTDPVGGVLFDLNGDGVAGRVAWTARGAQNAWLVLDRNGNGAVDGGVEMFGSSTPQLASATPNGFLALAEYDRPENGGNSSGVIDPGDEAYQRLRVWVDNNHDGLSEPGELLTFTQAGIREIELRYRESRRTDEFGNRFAYRAKVRMRDARIAHWAYDVVLVSAK